MTDTTTGTNSAPITAAGIIDIGNKIVEGVVDHEGLINTIAGMAGILPEVSLAEKALPILQLILQFLEQETGKGPLEVFKDLISHITPGGPLSPSLSETPEGT